MKIDVSSIKYDLGTVVHVDEDVKLADLEMRQRTIELPEPIHLALQVTNSGDEYLVMGHLRTRSRVICDRCLELFEYPLEVPFEELFPKEEMENENELDITDSLYEHLILELPLKMICEEHCKGLCPRCGQNLNLAECGCDRLVVDPRLVKLKEFLKQD